MKPFMSDVEKFEKIKDIVDAIMQSNGYREDTNSEWLSPRLNEIIDVIDTQEVFFRVRIQDKYATISTIIDGRVKHLDDVAWLIKNPWRWDLYSDLVMRGRNL